jgi:hypothetical protein
MNRLIHNQPFLLAALACSSSSAADVSCAQQMGQQRAGL